MMVYRTTAASTTGTTATEAAKNNELGKEAFLKLLILQMQNQDPLEPVKNEDFIAQLAQFNTLEQMQNLNKTAESMNSLQVLSQTAALVGKQVVYLNTTSGAEVQGTVKEVHYVDGAAKLLVEDASGNQSYAAVGSLLAIK